MDMANGGLFIVGGILGFILMWGIIKKILKSVCLFVIVFLIGCAVFNSIGVGKSEPIQAPKEEKSESAKDFLIGDFSEITDKIKGIF